jgi:DNA ligase-associated metallophosphoesterase
MSAPAIHRTFAEHAAAIGIAGESGLCDASGALFFPALSLLAVSDLHLEKGSALARRGTIVPPYDTAATLQRLGAVIAACDPRIVISLGDSFHDGAGAALMPEPFRRSLEALMRGREWFWVAGNHDPEPPAGIGGDSVREIAIGGLVFRHEPSPKPVTGEIAGHLHPGARLVRRGRSVRRRCFASDGQRLIMPAFGAYTGMLNVLDRAYAGLFDHAALTAYMLGLRRVYAVAGSALRPG